MNSEQELLAEEIIRKHKEMDGLFNWYSIGRHVKISNENSSIIKQTLLDNGLISSSNRGRTHETMLTNQGWQFDSFENERRKVVNEKSIQDQISELTLKKLKIEQFPAKFWWLIILIPAILSVLTTIIGLIIQHKYFPN